MDNRSGSAIMEICTMAGNTRGKLKERFEGIHKNFDWVIYHSGMALNLIKDHNPKLSKAIIALTEGVTTLDELAQEIYKKL